MKFENYSIVKCPTGISIKPNNGNSDLEVTLTIENDTLNVTLHAPDPSRTFLLWLSSNEGDWCEPVAQMQHSIKHYCECHATYQDCGYQDCCR